MKKAIIICLALVFPLALFSQGRATAGNGLWKQRRSEVFLTFGTTQFFGDIGGYSKGKNILGFKDISFKNTNFNLNTGLKYRITPVISARLNLTMGWLKANDARGINTERAFESNTFIFEPSLVGEYYFIRYARESSFSYQRNKNRVIRSIFETTNLYAFTGVGAVSHSSKIAAEGSFVGTINPKGFAATIPVGVGANVAYSNRIRLGLEITGRYCFTDYLEGYTSVYSKSNDVFYTFNATFIYYLNTLPNGLPSFLKSRRR